MLMLGGSQPSTPASSHVFLLFVLNISVYSSRLMTFTTGRAVNRLIAHEPLMKGADVSS